MATRPDTQQDSRRRLGRGRNAKTARNSEIFVTDIPTDMARCRVACPRLKIGQFVAHRGADDLLFILGLPHSNKKIEGKKRKKKTNESFGVKRKASNVKPDSSLSSRNCFAICCMSL